MNFISIPNATGPGINCDILMSAVRAQTEDWIFINCLSATAPKADIAQTAPLSYESPMKCTKMVLAALALALLGWWLLLENSIIADSWRLSGYIQIGFWLLVAVQAIIEWKNRRSSDYKEPSAASSGTWVVLATGGVAIVFLANEYSSTSDLLMLLAIAFLTAVAALLVYRFASRHENEIGEARFDTDLNDR